MRIKKNRILMIKEDFIISLLLTGICLASCEKIDLLNEDNEQEVSYPSPQTGTRTLNVVAKTSSSSTLRYPIYVYAFTSKGTLQTSATIANSNNSVTLSLPSGSYGITALYVPSSYPTMGNVTNNEANISMPECGYATDPIMLGSANVSISSSKQTANIIVGYRQASVNVSLIDVPDDISNVTVSLGSPYTDMTLAGNLSNKQVVTLQCSKKGTEWSTGTFYVMPTQGNQTTLTITFKSSSNTETSYSYTYNGSLNAGTPYSFTGTYSTSSDTDSDITVDATISAGEWTDMINDSFSFGPGKNDDTPGSSTTPATPSTSDNETFYVNSFPEEDGSIWNGHVVAFVDIDGNKCNAMLISLKDWYDVYSAYHATEFDMAKNYANNYSESGLSGWTIPNEDEGTLLSSTYCSDSNLSILNGLITECKGDKIYKVLESKNVRYLCENATKTYSFANTTKSAAGASVKYHLRLIKYVTLIKQ